MIELKKSKITRTIEPRRHEETKKESAGEPWRLSAFAAYVNLLLPEMQCFIKNFH
jgi:hypothetical protein